MAKWIVREANEDVVGAYEADDKDAALDKAAQAAGYKDHLHMIESDGGTSIRRRKAISS